MSSSAKSRNTGTASGLIASVSNLSAAMAALFADRRNRLRSFLLKRKGPPISSIISRPTENEADFSKLGGCVSFLARLRHAANADIKGNAPGRRSDAHNLGEEFAGAMPRRRSRILKHDFQVVSWLVLALTAEAHALCRNVDGHGFFKPGDPF